MGSDHHDIDNIAGFNNTQEEEEEVDSTFYITVAAKFPITRGICKEFRPLEKIFCTTEKSIAIRETLLKIIMYTDFSGIVHSKRSWNSVKV
jgi:hypothetical protein